MRINIIDSLEGKWVLGKVSLWDYLETLDVEDFNYSIQRGIVNNPYLDSILESVYSGDPIPPISLVAAGGLVFDGNTLNLKAFDILDGLQRTYRLWIYKKIAETAIKKKCYDYKKVTAIIRDQFNDYSKAISTRQVRSLFDLNYNGITVENIKEKFSNYNLYLYVWGDLTDSGVVKKMLILNAGQKRMAISHQYELMYLRLFKSYQSNHADVKLYRSKDSEYNNVKVGKRVRGEYNIPTIIIGMESLVKGAPVRLSSDLLFDKLSFEGVDEDGYIDESSVDTFFTTAFINSSIDILQALDLRLVVNDAYNKWFIKDTTISGIMAGFGKKIRLEYLIDEDFSANCRERALFYIDALKGQDPFDLKGFDREYNQLSSVKINIGMIVRQAICDYTFLLVEQGSASWKKVFSDIKLKK